MKTLFNLILTAALAWIITLFTPWWGVMAAALLVAVLVPLQGLKSFIIPFMGVFLLWAYQAYSLSSANDFTMAEKIATLLPLEGNTSLLIAVTAFIGGLAAGSSGMLGSQLRARSKS
ncbi:hypothetical protein E7Z59_02185 [Robertkochia marina]|uniref:Uncharacterized protein n=1 Tax=Robertkochia marina TaxID=1227945 RepID=A0A4S3M4C7_9FLAO|nr:hypothetical protein [Robertkochia marina]THD69161.1 hypothetical protein E7Z59_02185 [Robertkochia marina]TRZ47581.1 hypothetical protein D3A96_02415 [Robertkochia marina]